MIHRINVLTYLYTIYKMIPWNQHIKVCKLLKKIHNQNTIQNTNDTYTNKHNTL